MPYEYDARRTNVDREKDPGEFWLGRNGLGMVVGEPNFLG